MQDSDFQWFMDNYDDIFKKYGESYVAIRDKEVLGTYKSYAEGVKETMKKYPLGSFIVQFCNGDESGYTEYIASMSFKPVMQYG